MQEALAAGVALPGLVADPCRPDRGATAAANAAAKAAGTYVARPVGNQVSHHSRVLMSLDCKAAPPQPSDWSRFMDKLKISIWGSLGAPVLFMLLVLMTLLDTCLVKFGSFGVVLGGRASPPIH